MKKKKNYDLTHRVMRVRVGDYAFLAEVSRKVGVPMAEALHQVLTDTAKRERIVVPKSQIPMPAFQVVSQPTFRVSASPILAVNGNKAGVFIVKPKGGIIRG